MTMTTPQNRLAGETSPYLLQHAGNPVDWHPWGPEALDKARRENKPVLVSIGYAACHWCHVMEKESFEDEATAAVMNELFINIKVDREERPDLDKIYQAAHHMLNRRPGGWPLNVFITPDDHMPIFAGTYFPREARYGMPPFTHLLRQIAAAWTDRREDIARQSESMREALAGSVPAATAPLDTALPQYAAAELVKYMDRANGGFGQAPKFFHPQALAFGLRRWARQGCDPNDVLSQLINHTLHAMARGGIYDQLGGGFYRYSVDDSWTIPHFEKMLYDNGQLLGLYADAFIATGDDGLARIARETGQWMMDEMQSPQGAFYATLDADSEGEEGLFYTWTAEELQALLSQAEWEVMTAVYGITGQANFEGRWHLNVARNMSAAATALRQEEASVVALLASARTTLLAARAGRIRPDRDEKIITSWNGLAMAGLARAGRLLDEPAFVTAAEQALAFIRQELFREGRLFACTKDGRTTLPAYLDDYAFVLDGILELLQARWNNADLVLARQLADVMLARFQDPAGGFFFTADDHEQLIHRPKPDADEAIPSGNGMAALGLLRLGHLLAEPAYLQAAENTLRALQNGMARYPAGYGSLLIALDEHLMHTELLVLRGEEQALQRWQRAAHAHYQPWRLLFAITGDAGALPPGLSGQAPQGECVAQVCRGTQCLPPITNIDDWESYLAQPATEPAD